MEDITRIQPVKRVTLGLRAQATGELHELRGEMLIGREVECNIQIHSPQISRYHAKVSVSANGVFVEDLQSSNGTFINGNQIHKRMALSVGDELCFDEISYRVTTMRSGNAEFTSVSASSYKEKKNALGSARAADNARGEIKSIEDIDRIHRDSLKPLAPQANEGHSRPTPKFQFDDEERSQRKRAEESPQRPVRPPISPVPETPKAQQIDDVEAFLRFAGSGLKAQEPLTSKEASPFGLARQKALTPQADSLSGRGADSGVEPSARNNEPSARHNEPSAWDSEPSARENEPSAWDSEPSARNNEPSAQKNEPPAPKNKPSKQVNEATAPVDKPLAGMDKPSGNINRLSAQFAAVSEELKLQGGPSSSFETPKKPLSSGMSDTGASREEAQLPKTSAIGGSMAQPGVRVDDNDGVTTEESADEERTKFLGLNAINRYVSTNQQFQQDLELGSGPRFIAMTAPIRGKVFALQSDEDVTCWSIGRDDSVDICLRDPVVSREHAWITKLDALYQLRVNDTASGISVNGQTCTEADLHHGDRLQLGKMELVFRLDVRQTAADASDGAAETWWQSLKRSVANVFKTKH